MSVSLGRVMEGGTVHLDVHRSLRNCILPSLICGSEGWMWKKNMIIVCVLEMSYIRDVCSVTRLEAKSSESA